MSTQVAPLHKQPHALINTLIHTKPPLWLGLVPAQGRVWRMCVWETPVSPLISRHIWDSRQQGISVCVCVWKTWECEIGVIRQLTFKPHLSCATPHICTHKTEKSHTSLFVFFHFAIASSQQFNTSCVCVCKNRHLLIWMNTIMRYCWASSGACM